MDYGEVLKFHVFKFSGENFYKFRLGSRKEFYEDEVCPWLLAVLAGWKLVSEAVDLFIPVAGVEDCLHALFIWPPRDSGWPVGDTGWTFFALNQQGWSYVCGTYTA